MGRNGSKPLKMRFIGLDLAWSPRNNSAAVALEAENDRARWVAYQEQLGDNNAVLTFLHETAGSGPALIAIDAPLIVPNQEGARPVDRQITRLFGRYGAGCYPAYRNRPGSCTRGEEIVAALSEWGFVQDPYIRKRADMRSVFEVYPHPAMLALFSLERTIRYKARLNRSWEARRCELARLCEYIAHMEYREPAMFSPCEVMERDLSGLHGRALKHYEDLLDAAVCAYIAYYAWYWGPAGYQVYGDTATGYILIPMTDWMRHLLAMNLQRTP